MEVNKCIKESFTVIGKEGSTNDGNELRAILPSKKHRSDMGDGCNEKHNLKFYRFIWNFNKTTRPRILQLSIYEKCGFSIYKDLEGEAIV